MNLYKYIVTRHNGYTFSEIFTLGQIENGAARQWCKINQVGQDELERVPYVCDDKNREKVFAGDKVISPIYSHEGIVTYRPDFADYVIVKDGYGVDEGFGNFGCKSKDIELIKEQQ